MKNRQTFCDQSFDYTTDEMGKHYVKKRGNGSSLVKTVRRRNPKFFCEVAWQKKR